MAWMRLMGADSVAYHEHTVADRSAGLVMDLDLIQPRPGIEGQQADVEVIPRLGWIEELPAAQGGEGRIGKSTWDGRRTERAIEDIDGAGRRRGRCRR